MGFPGSSDSIESARNVRDLGSIPGLGRSTGGGHGNPLQYSRLENPMNGGAWQVTVHEVTKSQKQLKWLSLHTHTHTQHIVRNIWISTSHLQSPPRDFKNNWSERTDIGINLMRSFEAIPALLLLLLLWFLLGRVHVCKCVCACVCRLVDRQQMIFVLFPRATLTKYQKLIVFKLQKICCLTVWGIRSPKSCCLQGHDPSETFKGNLSRLMVACQQPLVLPGW